MNLISCYDFNGMAHPLFRIWVGYWMDTYFFPDKGKQVGCDRYTGRKLAVLMCSFGLLYDEMEVGNHSVLDEIMPPSIQFS
jgi:hypothetical protein